MSAGLACVIPAFDAAPTVAVVLARLRAAVPGATVIVVDDGSRDGTASAAVAGADVVVRHGANRGKGAALRSGIRAALERGAEVVVTLDADAQHPPEYVPALVESLRDADIAIGARQRAGTAMPPQRRLSNWMSSAVVSVLAGQRVEDSQSGFRAFRRSVLVDVEPLGDRFDLETDLLVRAARAGYRVASVPVPTVYAGTGSHFRPVRDTALLVQAMVRLGFAGSR